VSREREETLLTLISQRTREQSVLMTRLAGPQFETTPAQVGAMLIEQSGCERVIADLRQAVKAETARRIALEGESALWQRLTMLAEIINGERIATADLLHLLPDWVVSRDAEHLEQARREAERRRQDDVWREQHKAEIEARAAEIAAQEAEARARYCAVCEGTSREAVEGMMRQGVSLSVITAYHRHTSSELRKHAQHVANLPVLIA
jgi:hypothetical protein